MQKAGFGHEAIGLIPGGQSRIPVLLQESCRVVMTPKMMCIIVFVFGIEGTHE